MVLPSAANQRWSLDFISDAFTDGRHFRVLAVVDDFTRECLALVADTSLSEQKPGNSNPGRSKLWYRSIWRHLGTRVGGGYREQVNKSKVI
jgi:transposase InsO family protein